MKDLHSGLFAATLIGAAVLAADNTPTPIDLQGYDGAEVVLSVGIGGITFSGTNKIEFKLEHSADGASWSDVTDGDVLGVTVASGGLIKSLVAAHAAAATYRFGYIGSKRHLRLTADFSGTHGTGTPISAVLMLGRANVQPADDQA
jgi:hypothetical protein